MREIWEPVPEYAGCYEVSNLGNVRSCDRWVNSKNGSMAFKHGKLLRKSRRPKGYLCVNLSKDGKSRCAEIQRIVALAFIPNPDNLPCVNHKDEDKTNNAVDNLEWCTYKYNNNYRSRKEKVMAKRINSKTSKRVCQFDLTGNLICVFPSLAEVKRQLGYDAAKICGCALKRPHRRTAYGYIWQYQ